MGLIKSAEGDEPLGSECCEPFAIVSEGVSLVLVLGPRSRAHARGAKDSEGFAKSREVSRNSGRRDAVGWSIF